MTRKLNTNQRPSYSLKWQTCQFLIISFCALMILASSSSLSAQSSWQTFPEASKIDVDIHLDRILESKNLDSKESIVLHKERKGMNGRTIHAYAQYHEGIKIEGAHLTYHTVDGNLTAISDQLLNPQCLPRASVELSAEEAVQKAISEVDAEEYSWENKDYANFKNARNLSSSGIDYPEADLIFVPTNEKDESYALAYVSTITTLKPHDVREVFIDAQSGNTIKSRSMLRHTCNAANPSNPQTSTAQTLYNGSQSMITNLSSDGLTYELADCDRNIFTYLLPDGPGSTELINEYIGSSPNQDFSQAPTSLKAALNIHWAKQTIYEYFKINGLGGYTSNFDSFNDLWHPIISHVNFGNEDGVDNAWYNQIDKDFTYGLGTSGGYFNGQHITTLDIAAHEYGHAVTDHISTWGINYQGESGAINESFSDIISAVIDNYALETGLDSNVDPWLIGESIITGGLRNISNPSDVSVDLFKQPSTYNAGMHWADPNDLSNDYGGVHINSGVMNFWFYLLVNGGSGTNDAGVGYNVTALDTDLQLSLEQAFDITMACYGYLSYTPSFADMREATNLAVFELYGCNSQTILNSINDAWDAVNVIANGTVVCGLNAEIENPQTQVCSGQAIQFTNNQNNVTKEWFLNGVLQTGTPGWITFPPAGLYTSANTVELVVTDPGTGDSFSSEIIVYVDDCAPIVDKKGVMNFSQGYSLDFRSGLAQLGTYGQVSKESNISQTDDAGNLLFYIAANSPKLFDSNENQVASLSPLVLDSKQCGATVQNPYGDVYDVIIESITAGLYQLSLTTNCSGSSNICLEDSDPATLTPIPPPDSTYPSDENGAVEVEENVVVIPGCSENTYWILATSREYPTRRLLTYKLEYASSPGSVGVITYHPQSTADLEYIGTLTPFRVSPSGETIISKNDIYNFDRENGQLSYENTFPYNMDEGPWGYNYSGGCYSPSGRFYYATIFSQNGIEHELIQVDLENDLQVNLVHHSFHFNPDLFLGPDDKVYYKNYDALFVINNPNLLFSHPDFGLNENALSIDDNSTFRFSTYMEGEIFEPVELEFTVNYDGCSTIELNATACYSSYQWTIIDAASGAPVITLPGNNVSYELPSAGDYVVQLQAMNGLDLHELEDTISVASSTNPNLQITGPADFCGEGIGIYALPLYDTAGLPYVSFEWSITDELGNPLSESLIAPGLSTSLLYLTYGNHDVINLEVTLSNEEGCQTLLQQLNKICNEAEEIELICLWNWEDECDLFFESELCTGEICIPGNYRLEIRPLDPSITWNYTYSWTGPGTMADGLAYRQQVNGPGDYTVVLTDANGGQISRTFTVVVDEPCVMPPDVYCEVELICSWNTSVDGDDFYLSPACSTEVCFPGNYRLEIRPADPSVTWDYTYTWTGPGSPVDGLAYRQQVNGPGVYTVTLDDGNGNLTTQSYVVVDMPSSECEVELSCFWNDEDDGDYFYLNPSCNANACFPGNYRLEIHPTDVNLTWDYTYTWTGPGTQADGLAYRRQVTGPGNYTVTLTDSSGDTITKTFVVNALPASECEPSFMCLLNNADEGDLFFVQPTCNASVCFPGNYRLEVRPTEVSTTWDYTYAWTGPGTPVDGLAYRQQVNGPGTYTVTMTHSNGDTFIKSFTVAASGDCCQTVSYYCSYQNITQGDTYGVSSDCTYEACPGDVVVAQIGPSNYMFDDYTYTWDAGSPVGSGQGFKRILDEGPGIYTCTITDIYGCETVVPFVFTTADCSPAVKCFVRNTTQGVPWYVSSACEYTACYGDYVEIQISPQAAHWSTYTFSWNAGTPVSYPHRIIPDGSGTYTVTATDSNGNSHDYSFEYTEECCDGNTNGQNCGVLSQSTFDTYIGNVYASSDWFSNSNNWRSRWNNPLDAWRLYQAGSVELNPNVLGAASDVLVSFDIAAKNTNPNGTGWDGSQSFALQVSDGPGLPFTTLKTWFASVDFVAVNYGETPVFGNLEYCLSDNLSSANSVFRIVNQSTGSGSVMYIDNFVITACSDCIPESACGVRSISTFDSYIGNVYASSDWFSNNNNWTSWYNFYWDAWRLYQNGSMELNPGLLDKATGVNISFDFFAKSTNPNASGWSGGKSFSLQMSEAPGQPFTTIKTWTNGVDFTAFNYGEAVSWYSLSHCLDFDITCPGATFRIVNQSNSGGSCLYLDNILIETCTDCALDSDECVDVRFEDLEGDSGFWSGGSNWYYGGFPQGTHSGTGMIGLMDGAAGFTDLSSGSLDLSTFDEAELEFFFTLSNGAGGRDQLILEVRDSGGPWTIFGTLDLEDYPSQPQFTYNLARVRTSALGTATEFRIRIYDPANSILVFIDDITIRGCSSSSNSFAKYTEELDTNNEQIDIVDIDPTILVKYAQAGLMQFEIENFDFVYDLAYQIFNVTGGLVYADSTTSPVWEYDTRNLAPGVYIIATEVGSEKFIVR